MWSNAENLIALFKVLRSVCFDLIRVGLTLYWLRNVRLFGWDQMRSSLRIEMSRTFKCSDSQLECKTITADKHRNYSYVLNFWLVKDLSNTWTEVHVVYLVLALLNFLIISFNVLFIIALLLWCEPKIPSLYPTSAMNRK